jgi:S-ribosylhomocysteine lyase
MGCQTGFYLTALGKINLPEFKEYFIGCLKEVLQAGSIPGTQEKECGNYKSHSLEGAKKFAEKFLNGNIKII